MGPFRGAVFQYGGVLENSPLTLMGRFPSSMGSFLTLMGRLPACLNGPLSLLKNPLENSPVKKRGIKRFLKFNAAFWATEPG